MLQILKFGAGINNIPEKSGGWNKSDYFYLQPKPFQDLRSFSIQIFHSHSEIGVMRDKNLIFPFEFWQSQHKIYGRYKRNTQRFRWPHFCQSCPKNLYFHTEPGKATCVSCSHRYPIIEFTRVQVTEGSWNFSLAEIPAEVFSPWGMVISAPLEWPILTSGAPVFTSAP